MSPDGSAHTQSAAMLDNGPGRPTATAASEIEIWTFQSPEERRRYGYHTLDILATSNKDCLFSQYATASGYSPRRGIYVMEDISFSHCYNSKIHPKLLDILTSDQLHFPKFRELHAVVMGKPGGMGSVIQTYDTVLVVFDHGALGVEDAKDLALKIAECIKTEWSVNE